MKMEFNSHSHSANMNNDDFCQPPLTADAQMVGEVKKHFALVPSVVAFIGALIQLPYGFLASVGSEFIVELFGMDALRFAMAVIMVNVVLAAVTITAAVTALVLTAKQSESKTLTVTRILAIISLVLCSVTLIVNTVCVILFVM